MEIVKVGLKEYLNHLNSKVNFDEIFRKEQSINNLNLFHLISNQYQKENLHSDILTELLNQKEIMINGKNLLCTFIEYLNKSSEIKLRLNPDEFSKFEIKREKDRIDIMILGCREDETKKRNVIIIENKINGAPDQPRQIPKYYAKHKNNVKGIVYLPLKGLNLPYQEDWTKEEQVEINDLLIVLPAYNENKPSIIKWLNSTQNQITNIDCFFVIKQYIEILNHLAMIKMNLEEMAKFMEYISEGNNNENLKQILNTHNMLPKYQATQVEKNFKEYLNEYYTKISDVWENKSQKRWIFKCETPNPKSNNLPEVLRFSFGEKESKIHLWENARGDGGLNKIELFLENSKLKDYFTPNPKGKNKFSEYYREFKFPNQWNEMLEFIKKELIGSLKNNRVLAKEKTNL